MTEQLPFPPSSPPEPSSPTGQAIRMLELFATVGADSFDIIHTNGAGEKRGFRPAQSLEQARESMRFLVPNAAKRKNNLIIRPRSSTVTLIQLDDLTDANLARIAGKAVLTLSTSPAGRQAWISVKDGPAGFSARLKEGLEADKEASGATRIAGSYNFKEKYSPAYPLVSIITAQPGLVVTPDELEVLGVLAPVRPQPPPLPFAASDPSPRTGKWPSYQRCLDGAPIGSSGNPKRTSADFAYCKIAISWGHSIEATAAKLMQESIKAQENGEAYALKTAQHAEYAARERNAQPRQSFKPR
jgi:hypothetical protein